MTDRPAPALTGRAEADRLARIEREAAALRANLRRRKDQQRALPEAAGKADHPSGGPPPGPGHRP